MKIAFFEINPEEQKTIEKSLKGHQLIFSKDPLTENNASRYSSCDIVSTFIYSRVTKKAIDSLPALKMISTRSTGYDHIDVKYCSEKGIKVLNVPFYGENTIAEYAFALLLTLIRKIPLSMERSRNLDFKFEDLLGSDLKGKTLGVVGAGHIGLHLIKIARGFDMNVVAYDVRKNESLARSLGFTYASIEEVLKKSDVISLHAPALPETYHLLNSKTFKLVKKGAVLINTARGTLVETSALIKALDSGIISGVAMDVLEEEKDMKAGKTSPEIKSLLQRENVIFTPHIGFYSKEALERILATTISNIQAFTQNKTENLVAV